MIDGKENVYFLMDTGSDVNIITRSILKRMNVDEDRIYQSKCSLKSYNKS